jgi:hypothetical protein
MMMVRVVRMAAIVMVAMVMVAMVTIMAMVMVTMMAMVTMVAMVTVTMVAMGMAMMVTDGGFCLFFFGFVVSSRNPNRLPGKPLVLVKSGFGYKQRPSLSHLILIAQSSALRFLCVCETLTLTLTLTLILSPAAPAPAFVRRAALQRTPSSFCGCLSSSGTPPSAGFSARRAPIAASASSIKRAEIGCSSRFLILSRLSKAQVFHEQEKGSLANSFICL